MFTSLFEVNLYSSGVCCQNSKSSPLLFVSATGTRGSGLGGPQLRVSTMGWVSGCLQRLNIYMTAHGFSFASIFTSRCNRVDLHVDTVVKLCSVPQFHSNDTPSERRNNWKMIKDGGTVIIKAQQICLFVVIVYSQGVSIFFCWNN